MNSKKNSNNNSLLSIGTESMYSETSNLQSGGGIMNWLLGSGSGEYATELALDAFKNQYPQIAYFIIRHAIDKSVKLDFGKKDANKQTLIHHLVSYSKFPIMKDLTSVVLSNTEAKKYINEQDENGDTPAHIAARDGLDLIIDELVAHGANLTIANNANKVVHVESGNNHQRDIFTKSDKKSSQNQNDIETQLNNLLGPLIVKTDSDTLNSFRRSEAMQDSYRQPAVRNNIFSEQSMSVNSDDILDQIIKENNNHQYGGSKIIKGRRSMVSYSEEPRISHLTGGESEDFEDDFSDAEISSIARVVENQASEAHKRSVERIMEILGVDEIEAKAYKAILYDTIKNESQKSNYDRAIELEKRASNKEILEKISKKEIKNMVKLINDKHKMKESSSQSDQSSEPVKPKRNKKVKDVMTSESGLDSVTSIDIE